MSDALQSWVERSAAIPGVLACAARMPDQSIFARSSYADFSTTKIGEVVTYIVDTMRMLEQNRIPVRRLQWTFEASILYCSAESDGSLRTLVIGKGVSESAELKKVLEEFLSPPA